MKQNMPQLCRRDLYAAEFCESFRYWRYVLPAVVDVDRNTIVRTFTPWWNSRSIITAVLSTTANGYFFTEHVTFGN